MALFRRKRKSQEELLEELNTICQNNCFDYAKYLGEYKGEKIYQPSFDYDGDILFGRPCFLHVKGNRIRRSKNHKEVSEIIRYFFPTEDED